MDCICWSSVGIEPTGNRVKRPAVFTVDAFSAGQGQVTVYLDHPDGTREEVRTRSWLFWDLLWFYIVVSHLIVVNVCVCVCVLISWRQSLTRARRRSASPTFLKWSELTRWATFISCRRLTIDKIIKKSQDGCCFCFLGDRVVCRPADSQKSIRGERGQGARRRHQGHGQRPGNRTCGQHRQQTHLLWHLHCRSDTKTHISVSLSPQTVSDVIVTDHIFLGKTQISQTHSCRLWLALKTHTGIVFCGSAHTPRRHVDVRQWVSQWSVSIAYGFKFPVWGLFVCHVHSYTGLMTLFWTRAQ